MRKLFSSLIFKIVFILIVVEMIVVVGLGIFNYGYFSNRIEERYISQLKVPGQLMLESALRYRSVNDPTIMEQFVGDNLSDALLIGVDMIVYYSLNAEYRNKTTMELTNLEYLNTLNQQFTSTKIAKGKDGSVICITPIYSESKNLLGYLYLKAGTKSIQAEKRVVLLIFVLGSIIAVVVTFIVGYLFSIRFERKMKHLITLMKDIAEGEGDLTKRIEIASQDEIGQIAHYYNLSAEKLKDIIAKVQEMSENLASAFRQVSASTGSMTKNTATQTNQITNISNTIQELFKNVIEISKITESMVKQARASNSFAFEGININKQLIRTMLKVQEGERSFTDKLNQLNETSDNISGIVTLISDIADQTKILAMNAKLEAVKAGEHGVGFTVVANEIRNLALKTQTSTSDIIPMIESIQVQIKDVIKAMTENLALINNVTMHVDALAQMNERISRTSEQTLTMAQKTTSIYQEHNQSIENIMMNTDQISSMSKETSVSVSQVSETINQLNDEITDLRDLVRRFVVSDSAV